MISQKDARELLWRSGILRWQLDINQQGLYDGFYNTSERRIVYNCGRRVGKTYLLSTIAIEHALRIPGAEIKYIAPTKDQAKRLVTKAFKPILEGCPADIRPEWYAQDKTYEFKNGATLAIGAMDSGRGDTIRGTDCHLGIVDEAGFSPSHYVEEMVEGILRPMTLLTRGKICIASTPAKTPRHQFELYYNEAKLRNAAFHRTIYDNPRLTAADIEEEIKLSGGKDTTYFRREYMAEFVVDEELIVIPEFNHDKQAEIVREWEKPSYFDAYVSMDFGAKDGTGIIFYYYDFRNAKLIVEDEIWLYGVKEIRTDIIANAIREKERTLWGDKKPYFRVSDVDHLLINDLSNLHGLQFHKTEQDYKEASVNELRLMIKGGQVIINPRCKNLIDQLQACVWNKKRDSFDRVKGYGHFDMVDALLYGLRATNRGRNPFPADKYSYDTQFFADQPYSKTPNAQLLEMVFKLKKPR